MYDHSRLYIDFRHFDTWFFVFGYMNNRIGMLNPSRLYIDYKFLTFDVIIWLRHLILFMNRNRNIFIIFLSFSITTI